MSKIINFPNTPKSNVLVMPRIFTKLYEMYKAKQDDIRKRKIKFLEKQAFQFFLDLEPMPEEMIQEQQGSINIPVFVQLEQAEKTRRERAYNKASRAMLDVISQGRVNECFTKRVKQLKKMNIKVKI